MFFDVKLAIILAIILTNFSILFLIKDRINILIGLISSYLLTTLFLSISISNYSNLKELIFALALHLMIVLCLFCKSDSLAIARNSELKLSNIRILAFLTPVILAVLFSSFWIANNLVKTSNLVVEKKIERRNQELFGSFKTSSSEIIIDEYRGIMPKIRQQKIESEKEVVETDKSQNYFNMSAKEKARLKDKLSDNFLLKGFSNFILVIVAFIIGLLLYSNFPTKQTIKNENL